MRVRSFSFGKYPQACKIKAVNLKSKSLRALLKRTSDMKDSIYPKPQQKQLFLLLQNMKSRYGIYLRLIK